MPGLVGAVSLTGKAIHPGLLPAMRDAIRHRDGYTVDDYVHAKGTVAISRVNLGVINTGRQPHSAGNGRVKVFLHGELYNDEIGRSDPLAFIYRLYEKAGAEFAASLHGSFVVVIVDEDRDIVLVANDRIAAKPLFYFSDGRAVYFGPEMKSLLPVPSLARELDLAALADFLANGHFTAGHTLIQGLQTMDSATVLQITSGGMTRHRYWKFENERQERDRGPEDYQARLAALLRSAVRRRLRSDRSYGILLSGGYDSRAILGCYLEERAGEKPNTLSWGREEDIPGSDCLIAKRLAQELGAQHTFYHLAAREVIDRFHEFVFLGEGLTDFPESYDVFKRIREQQQIDIVLRGDECFGFSKWLKVHDERTMFLALGFKSLENTTVYKRILKPSHYRAFCEFDAETTRYRSSRCSARNVHNRKDFFYLDVRLKNYLNPLNYVKNFYVESFTPFLDYDLLDFIAALPVRYRLGKRFYRSTVVHMFPELYAEIAQQHNMIDWAASLKGSPELERFVYRELLEGQNLLSEFLDLEGLKSELDAFFSTGPHPQALDKRARGDALKALEGLPTAYRLAHKCFYSIQKHRGKVRDVLLPEQWIIRLLILKAWGDMFLTHPVARAPEGRDERSDLDVP